MVNVLFPRWLELAALLSILMIPSLAEEPAEEWNRTFGGPHGDGAWSLQYTKDGGYAIAGYTSSRGQSSDLWLIKCDSRGLMEWNRTVGGSGEDIGYSIKQTGDGGYVIAGTTKSYGIGSEYVWLLKTDANGSIVWDGTFGGFVSSSGDGAWSVDVCLDGGYIIAGYTRSSGAGGKDMWLIKTDSRGKIQWERTFGGPKDDVGMSAIQTLDGGYIVTGRTASYGAGKDDIWLLKTNADGIEIWNRTFGGSGDDAGLQAIEVKDGYIITGRTESVGTGKKAFLLKTDLHGRLLWEKIYGTDSVGVCVQLTSDGGFIMAGYIESLATGRDAFLVKADAQGKEQWNMILGGYGQDMATSVVESADGGYVLAGITDSYGAGAEDAWLVKVRVENATVVPATLDGNTTVGNGTQADRAGGNGTDLSRPPATGNSALEKIQSMLHRRVPN